VAKKPNKMRSMNVYSNLAHKRRTKKDAESRKKAEYLASLPKHPLKRILYRLHPKRVLAFWFSKKGLFMALKIVGVSVLLVALLVGGLFAYYRKDLDSIQPGELANRVQTTVTKYLDRNGNLLWEDTGSGDYKLVVNGSDISTYMKEATVAIEDKDFYKHGGVSISGTLRAVLNNANGGSTQGGSTLTQQLVKQVFFADQASDRGISGIPRKIKEAILAIEVERMYNKEQILDLYLNESPYGGRRNGVESGAQTYFGVSSKDLTLPEAALLAAIPNNPNVYDPYNTDGNQALIERQQKVLDNMADQGYITKAQADAAKSFPILDSIKPESDQYQDVKAPHFVQMVKAELEQKLGKATVGQGGLTITTTLDLRVQGVLEQAMQKLFASKGYGSPAYGGFDDGAGTVEDNATGQIIALDGSRDYSYPGYGQNNAAVAYLQPGSSVKPLVFSQLFSQQPAGKPNWGSGSILPDVNIDSLYGAPLHDDDNKFLGNITIRDGLAQSRNVPAVEAMSIAGEPQTLATIRAMGDMNYCTQGQETQVGLSAAIGACGTRQIDHVNAFASLARGGVYKPQSTVLQVTNSQGVVIDKWQDSSTQVVDPQAAYVVSDILTDGNARKALFGSITTGFSYGNTGIKTATKTGTSNIGNSPKDVWMMTYSPVVSMGVWLGNHDSTPLTNGNSTMPGPVIDAVMRYVHLNIYGPTGKWKPGDWIAKPAGIQTINNEVYPSWYNPNQGKTNSKMNFDKVSKFKATSCTPQSAVVSLDVSQTTDPITKKPIYSAPSGYDATQDDNVHNCSDVQPSVSGITITGSGATKTISATVTAGTHPLQQLEIKVGDTVVGTIPVTSNGSYSSTYTFTSTTQQTITATVTDAVDYTASTSTPYTPDASSGGGG